MSEVKAELKAVLKGELAPLAVMYESKHVLRIHDDIMQNDNLLQELENVVLSYSKPRLESQKTIDQLSYKIDSLTADKAKLLQLYNDKERELGELQDRNKRLSRENKKLQDGIVRTLKRQDSCDHVTITHSEKGLEVNHHVRVIESGKGTYTLKCTKCNKRF